ncbi:MAG: HAMP domain-containing histidine kinase [Elusimicrobia bacterium]|nr:HAMP domain-containing histidine kinase [Elusimicrobiota bacterium]
MEITPAAAATLMALAAILSGFAVYWFFRFKSLLPAQRSLEQVQRQADELRQFFVRKSREAETLLEVAAAGSRSSQERSTLSAIVSIVARYLEADLVAFLLLDESTGELVTQPGAYGLEGDDLLYRIPLTEEGSSSVRVFRTGQPFITGDAQNDPGVISGFAKLWRAHSLMVIALRKEGHSIGVMRVGSFKRDFFTQEHLDLLKVIADEATVIVETAILNRRLGETAEQLQALSRMKDEFVTTVSHEFKTPLTTIRGFVSVMRTGDTGALTDQQEKFLTVVDNAVRKLEQLVTELLDLSKLEGGAAMDMRSLSLGELVSSVVDAHRGQAVEAGKVLVCEIPQRLPSVRGDEKWLRLVVDNLVSNALKFTKPGGRVAVSAMDKGDLVMVRVEDDGIGIHPEDKPNIFQKFYRARNSAELAVPGTGLGLAISREIINKHAGRIWFESEPGRGSKFFFVLSTAARGEAVPA